jgi:tetratricopeptide (TPR) repeat protein
MFFSEWVSRAPEDIQTVMTLPESQSNSFTKQKERRRSMPNSNTLEAEIRRRLQSVAKAHPQAEIARKTGTSPANVNRYLKQNRIPVSFCAALVKGLGVNPAWLLVGEGTPYLADVASGNEKLATNLLALVQAMSSVASMRLGSLAGKRGLSVLRELNDALTSYEQLKAKLNEHSRDIFAQVLKDWRAALDSDNEERAIALRKAAEQVSRLCEDRALEFQFLSLLARHHYKFADLRQVPDIQRRVFLHTLGSDLDEASFNEARLLVSSLESLGRSEEAERVARALIALAEKNGPKWKNWAMLLALHGTQLLALRDLKAAVSRLHEAIHMGAGEAARHWLHSCYFFMGTLSAQEYRKGEPFSETRADMSVRYSLWLEEVDAINAAIADYEKARMGTTHTGRFEPTHGKFLVRAITHREKRVYTEYWQAVKATPFFDITIRPWNVCLRDWACQLARYTGRSEALKDLSEADTELLAFPPDVRMPMHLEATHHRNALELINENERDAGLAAMRARAVMFFREHIAKGYGFLENYARKRGLLA